jgi:hypothetical protein
MLQTLSDRLSSTNFAIGNLLSVPVVDGHSENGGSSGHQQSIPLGETDQCLNRIQPTQILRGILLQALSNDVDHRYELVILHFFTGHLL